MTEYIEREKAEEAFDNADPDVCESDLDGHSDWGFGRKNVRDVIRGVPAADVVPVVHGQWVDAHGDRRVAECSVCKELFEVTFDGPSSDELFAWFARFYRYCPNCGARMDGDKRKEGVDNG